MDVDGERVITSDQSTNSERRQAARAGRGDRRRRDRGRVRLGVHRPRRGHHAAGGDARTACCRSGPTATCADVLAKSLPSAAPRSTPRPGSARWSTPTTGVVVPFETPKGSEKIEVDQVLVSIGRRPVTEGIGAEEAGVRIDERGFIEVDTNTMLTSRPGRLRDRRLRRHTGPGPRRLRRGRGRRRPHPRREPGAGRLRQGAVGRLHLSGGGLVGHDRGAGPGGRLRRRGAQALVRRQRPGHDPRRDRRPGEGRRRRRTARSWASTWSDRGPASCCTRATWR